MIAPAAAIEAAGTEEEDDEVEEEEGKGKMFLKGGKMEGVKAGILVGLVSRE